MHRAKLLDCRAIPLTTGDIPVATDVFLHNLEPRTLEALRRAVDQGLTPSGLDFTGDDDSGVILRFTDRSRGETGEMTRERSVLGVDDDPTNCHGEEALEFLFAEY
jgi:hypothetical protein